MSNASTDSNDPSSMKHAVEIVIRIGLLLLLLVWSFLIVRPFITPIVEGIVIAIGSYPVFLWLNNKMKLGTGLGATLFTLLMVGLLITPTVMLRFCTVGFPIATTFIR